MLVGTPGYRLMSSMLIDLDNVYMWEIEAVSLSFWRSILADIKARTLEQTWFARCARTLITLEVSI